MLLAKGMPLRLFGLRCNAEDAKGDVLEETNVNDHSKGCIAANCSRKTSTELDELCCGGMALSEFCLWFPTNLFSWHDRRLGCPAIATEIVSLGDWHRLLVCVVSRSCAD